MTWQLFELRRPDGRPLQLMLDDRFRAEPPGAELPTLTRIRVFCAQAPEDYYWHPDESAEIEAVEDALLARADEFGEGWAVYVQRRAEPGCLEYCFYSGGDAALGKVVPALEAAWPGRRFAVEVASDSGWAQYGRWFAEAIAGAPNPDFAPARDAKLN